MSFELRKRYNDNQLKEFADYVQDISAQVGFKVSSRGWCYILETNRLINKDEFDKVEELINNCRRKGFLPIDFCAEEASRQFHGVETPDTGNVIQMFGNYLRGAQAAPEHFVPDWWEGEEYYIQMVVEKIDLVTLFEPVCAEFHIPIANAKGWSSILQRAEYARRYAEAEDNGLKCVLLYCGDHDPDGLRISDFIHTNLVDLQNIEWSDGTPGYDPKSLIIERFGLNYDYIIDNNYTWIDNLITGSGKDLGSSAHKNHKMDYVQDYLKTIGRRKCEANVIVVNPDSARQLVRTAIEKYLGDGATARFETKRQALRDEFDGFLDNNGFNGYFDEIHRAIRNY